MPVEPSAAPPATDAADFIRYCYGRRRVRWPELYDEMCAVASRRLFRGWSFMELAEHGVRFTLFDLPGLAALAEQVAFDERALARARDQPEAPPETAASGVSRPTEGT
ncbi:MAG: hypothetical protein H0X16_03415 [Chloroflexi bacterium]|nr:hypothetical protein [Chloroflexota bacterium]